MPETLLDERFRLDAVVARGGMGEIWRATDLRTSSPVAVKRMLAGQPADAEEHDRARLLREIQALQGLEHPNLVRCLGWGSDADHRPYLVLEWLRGEDLARRQRRQPLSLDEAALVVGQALDGLAAAHRAGVIHRDIKPSNLFLSAGGAVKVLDFGLARLADRLTRITRSGCVTGTLYYLAPEQVQGGMPVDHRADIYAAGVVLYELVTGRLPFEAEEPVAVMLKILSESPDLPGMLREDLPDWLEHVILRAMMRAPDARFQTAEAMLDALSSRRDWTAQTVVSQVRPGLEPSRPGAAAVEQRLVCLLCAAPAGTASRLSAEVVRPAVEQLGGVSYALVGGQAVGIFGLSRTTGEEALAGARAGLRALEASEQGALRLLLSTVRLNVAQGLQLDTRDLDRLSRALTGLPSGELVVDAATQALLGDRAQLAVRGEHRVLAGLVRRGAARRRVLGVEIPMLGREAELAALQATFARAVENGEPEALLLVGSPGIGKSRLLAEARASIRQHCALCLEGRAEPSRQGTPYSLLADTLLRHADRADGGRTAEVPARLLPELLARHIDDPATRDEAGLFIAEAIGLTQEDGAIPEALRVARGDPQLMRERIGRAFETLLAAAAASGPVCLSLDDLQWADAESLELCEALLERLEDTPLLLLCAARPGVLETRPRLFRAVDGAHLQLEPVGRRPLRRLIAAAMGAAPSRELVDLVLERSGGNPYFAEELLAWMAARGFLERAGDRGWQLRAVPAADELPEGIEAAIQGRLDLLDLEDKELIKAVSVFGERLWEGGCAALGFSRAGEQLAGLERAELVVRQEHSRLAGEREWAFRHGLVRQVAHAMLPEERRRELHLAAARWLEAAGETDPAALAHHFRLGGDRARAATHLGRAGARNLAEGNLEQAADSFRAALEGGTGTEGERAARRLGLAKALYRLGRNDAARDELERLRPAPGTDHALEAIILRAKLHLGQTRAAEAEALLLEATAPLHGSADLELLFEARHALFWVIWVQGRYHDAGVEAEALLELIRRTEREDQASAAKMARAYYHAVAGDLSRTLALAREAVEHARAARHPYREMDSLLLLGYSLQSAGLYDEALDTLEQARALAARLRSRHHLASIQPCRGQILAERGQAEQARACFAEARQLAAALGDQRTMATALAYEARLLAAEGTAEHGEEAEALAREALALVAGKLPPVEAEVHLALARALLARGQGAPALEQARRGVALLDQLGDHEPYAVEILLAAHDAQLAEGQPAAAATLLQRARALLQERGARISDARVRDSFLSGVPHHERVIALSGQEG